jgi:hypothetical protein
MDQGVISSMGIVTLTVEGSSKIDPTVPLSVRNPLPGPENLTESGTRFPDLKSSRGVGPEIVSGGQGEKLGQCHE